MTSKCSRLPSSLGLLLTLTFLVGAPRAITAQAPPPPPPPANAPAGPDAEPDLAKLRAEAEAQAHLRVWNLLPKDGTAFDVLVSAGGKTFAADLRPGQFPDSYQDSLPGTYRLSVFKAGDRVTPLAEVPAAALGRNTYHTLILIPGPDPSHPRPLLVDDTYAFETTPTGQLFVWQGFDGAVATVTVGTERRENIPAQEARLFENLPVSSQPVTVAIQTRKPDGKVVDYQLMVPFNDCRRAAVVIVPDRFDRVRPRLVQSGEIVPPAARRGEPGR